MQSIVEQPYKVFTAMGAAQEIADSLTRDEAAEPFDARLSYEVIELSFGLYAIRVRSADGGTDLFL